MDRDVRDPLIQLVLEKFCARFTPGARVLCISGAGDKWALFEHESMAALGGVVDEYGRMPDVVLHYETKNWLVLIEAVTSHGPVNAKRHEELKRLFKGSAAGLVFVTAFLTRKALLRYLGDIAWETEVWVAESPSHMIHFDGTRFLGPYEG